MSMPLPEPSLANVNEILAFLRDIDVDTVCIVNTNEMMKRYQMVVPLLNVKYGETIDGITLRAFRQTFETVIV